MTNQRQFDSRISQSLLLALVLISTEQATSAGAGRELWVYCPANFLVEAECKRVHEIMQRAAKAGYTHVLVSVWIKTENFPTPVEIKLLNDRGQNFSYTYLNVKPAQDWAEHHVTFNSLDQEELNFYIGSWGPKSGKLWLRDAKLESTGAVNLVRRATAPIQVQLSSNGKPVDLKELVDFEPWADSKLGQVPYSGEYEAWHEPPPIRLKRKLPTGSLLNVSYFHTHIIHESQVCGTIGDEKFEHLLEQQVAAIGKLIPADSYMMSHDEYRVMGWTQPSIPGVSKQASPGELITHNAKTCYQAILRSNPQARVLTWSDMFDPFHNAVAEYYLVNGSLTSASLPKQVVVMNWNSDKKAESIKHFDRLGHHQIIAGYYDESPDQINNWLNAVMKHQLQNVDGVMYATWKKDYSSLEAFAENAKNHAWFAH